MISRRVAIYIQRERRDVLQRRESITRQFPKVYSAAVVYTVDCSQQHRIHQYTKMSRDVTCHIYIQQRESNFPKVYCNSTQSIYSNSGCIQLIIIYSQQHSAPTQGLSGLDGGAYDSERKDFRNNSRQRFIWICCRGNLYTYMQKNQINYQK